MRTIDADALKKQAITLVTGVRTWEVITVSDIDNAPTIDDLSEYSDKLWQKAYERGKEEARPTGHWNYASFGNQTLVKCSECEEEFLGKDVSDYRFCPICGCRMIEEAENDS